MILRRFIPQYVSNRIVIGFLNLLRVWQRTFHICWKNCDKHHAINSEYETVVAKENDDYKPGLIENQKELGYLRFGKTTMAYAGCEILAVYNVLYSLGTKANLADLIHTFEHDGMVLSGRFGTAPKAISDFFNKRGYTVKMSQKEKDFEAIASQSKNMILTMYNNRFNIMDEVHTVCITKAEDGLYAHNVYGDGSIVGPASSISDMLSSINNGRTKGICLMSIEG